MIISYYNSLYKGILRCYFFSTFISNKPIAVQINSRMRTISATKIPALAVSPNSVIDIKKPPSRPPSCKGIKNNKLANSVVKAIIKIHAMKLICGKSTQKILNFKLTAERDIKPKR